MDERLKISNMKDETLALKENYPKNIYLNEYCYCNHLHSLKLPVGTMFSS